MQDLGIISNPRKTSRTQQKGNGLGLTIVYSIIKNHDGFVFVESEQEIGTKFFIYLHAHDGKHGFEEKRLEKSLREAEKSF
nr:hypothetical protein [Deltaproteobacteria bacterium]